MEDKVIVAEPEQKLVDEWKKKYGRVFRVVVGGDTYIYRRLIRPEYREFQKLITPEMTQQGPVVSSEQQSELEDKIFEKCVLFPIVKSNNDLPAGVPSVLSTYISDSSGFVVDEAPKEL